MRNFNKLNNMSKYCNGCKRDLEIDNSYSYKKSICNDCLK